MQERDYAAELYDKMAEEQSRFKDWLLTQPPEEILNHAYRYAVQEDILCAVEEMELDPKQAKQNGRRAGVLHYLSEQCVYGQVFAKPPINTSLGACAPKTPPCCPTATLGGENHAPQH